jgi:arylsulfatase
LFQSDAGLSRSLENTNFLSKHLPRGIVMSHGLDYKVNVRAGLLAAFALLIASSACAQAQRPNVVFILADNVGYGDMGPYGGGELRGMPTPRTDQLAREGLRLTQFLVEPACSPSRAALMTGQYSIRNGLSLVVVPGTPNELSGKAYTMGQLFKDAGYATALFGKWHLGSSKQSLPSAHGFDEFYGIPPDTSWDDAVTVPLLQLSHAVNVPEKDLIEKGPWIMAQKAGGALQKVKPFTAEVRAEIDNDLTDRAIAFIKQQAAAKKPFFLYFPFSMGHAPNYPSQQFAGKSRIGQYGDKMMEGDYHVGQLLDTLKELKIDDNTILVFASDNGPWGMSGQSFGNLGSPDVGSSAPSVANSARLRKARSGLSASSAGPGTYSQTPPLTPCSRSWTFCRPSRQSSAGSCRRIVQSMG